MYKDLLTPNSKCKFILDDVCTVSIETEHFISIHYDFVGEGTLCLVIKPISVYDEDK